MSREKKSANKKEIISKIKKEDPSGITLIALVITIIVLLLLAGVTIATLTGDNGMITKAQEAKEKTEKAEIEEQLRLARTKCPNKKSRGLYYDRRSTRRIRKSRNRIGCRRR